MSVNFQASACKAEASLGLRQGKPLPEDLTAKPATLERGFTLIELLAVITLLAIIATITTMGISDVGAEAQDDLSHIEMAEIRKAVLQFKRDVGHFPDAAGNFDEVNSFRLKLLWSCQSVNAAVPAEPLDYDYDAGCRIYSPDTKRGWNGPYLLSERKGDEAGLFDPWGSRYQLLEPESATPGAGSARIVSLGPNRTYDGHNANICMPNGDDVVLCLVQ